MKLNDQFTIGVTQDIDEVVSGNDKAQLVFQKHFDQFDEAKKFENLVMSRDKQKINETIKGD